MLTDHPLRVSSLARYWADAILLLALAVARPAAAAEPTGLPFDADPVLRMLTAEALEKRPEVSKARALIDAESQSVPQASAWPDPSLTFGIQNDSFTQIQIGQMGTSFVAVMASQRVPFIGKLGLRNEVATLSVRAAEADLQRVRLSVRAEVERAYVDLLLVRDQLGLLGKLDALWQLSEGLARTRYEAGEGAQSDLLRAQLERNRLSQRRWALTAEELRRVAVLNRLRGRALGDRLPTTRSLADVPDPVALQVDVDAQSPELEKARRAVEQSHKRVDLARKDFFPDPTLNAGVMARGKLDPMWLLSVSFAIPVWAAVKQARAVSERELRLQAAADETEALRQLLNQRMRERAVVLEALLKTNQLYRDGLLVLSESTVTSTLAQYQVGKVTFASVLEVLVGYLADLNGFLESVAATQRIATAQRELSLEPVSGLPGGGMPAVGAMGGASAVQPGEAGNASPAGM